MAEWSVNVKAGKTQSFFSALYIALKNILEIRIYTFIIMYSYTPIKYPKNM